MKVLFIILLVVSSLLVCEAKTAPCIYTVYHKKFEGRKDASGKVFSHKNMTVATNKYPLGTVVELKYGRNGRAIATITDRGGLPLHRYTRPQFDCSIAVARKLGLYSRPYGRLGQYRVLSLGSGRNTPKPSSHHRSSASQNKKGKK